MASKLLSKLKCYSKGLFLQPVVRIVASFKPIEKHKYFCISMNGNNYGDNIKQLADYIKVQDNHAVIIWAFTDDYYSKVDCLYKKVRLCSFLYFYHILTARYILSNFAMDFSFLAKKRKGQVYLETWHGTALKRIGYDMYQTEKPDILYRWFGVDRIRHTMDMTDILITGSNYMSKLFRNSFKFSREIYEIGTPRNDIFFHERLGIIDKIKNLYGIGTDERIILYAPTFRLDRSLTYYDVDLGKIKAELEKRFGHAYRLMARLHPVMLRKESSFMDLFPQGTINASFYPDMQELLYCSDVLVTDYSSSMFDFMYLKRTIILYVPDRDVYSRGFYWDIDKLPFIVLNSNEEICVKLQDYQEEKYKERIDEFLSEIGSAEDGHATENAYKLLTKYDKVM